MFWIFAAVVLFLAVVNPDFRKVVLWLGAAALAVVILCVLLQLNSERSAAPVAAPVAAIEAPAPVVVPEPVAAPTPVAVVKHHHVKPAAPVAPAVSPPKSHIPLWFGSKFCPFTTDPKTGYAVPCEP
jgi:hypothetical protein